MPCDNFLGDEEKGSQAAQCYLFLTLYFLNQWVSNLGCDSEAPVNYVHKLGELIQDGS